MELLGIEYSGLHGGIKCDWSVYSLLVAGNSDLGIGTGFLYFH